MRRSQTDIVIAGGGIAGMSAAAILAGAGFDVVCIEPQPPGPDTPGPDADLRSTAFLEPAIDLFRDAGLWGHLAPHATDLRVMRLADSGGAGRTIREVADFDAAELGQPRFGANIANWRIRRVLADFLDARPGAALLTGQRVARFTPRTREAIVTLSDGSQLAAPLVIAADGRNSFLRDAADIGVTRWDYGQKALVFAVSHPLPHDNVSTEIHRSGGPFTLVPLPDQNGVPHSAVVWMETGPHAGDLMALSREAFEIALKARACGILGPLKLATPLSAWPIISQIAHRFDGPRLALVAEAAHVMPPIGAQGLNTSLADIRALRDLVAEARQTSGDIGAPALLARYSRARHADAMLRVAGTDALNRAAMAESPVLHDLRRAGLKMLRDTAVLKRASMQLGLGAGRTAAE